MSKQGEKDGNNVLDTSYNEDHYQDEAKDDENEILA